MATTTDASKEDPDQLFKYDPTVDGQLRSQRVWSKDPSYFKKVKISATALVKMVMHALAGGDIEVMGLMVGRIEANTMIVMDSFALPVEGTETRVNAQSEGYEYASTYMTQMEQVGRPEKGIGWYHSHPGYGCWLSGIDVSTQMLQQKYSEPWLAVVIDPKRTAASGKVELGAFRTYPENYKPPDAGPSEYQSVPLDKIEDFGVHANAYYPLEVSYFKSSLDAHLLELLWTKYWVATLAASPLLANRDFIAGQIKDISEKMDRAETQIAHGSKSSLGLMLPAAAAGAKKDESQLAKLTKDSAKSTIDQVNGLMNQVLKELVFNVKPPRRR